METLGSNSTGESRKAWLLHPSAEQLALLQRTLNFDGEAVVLVTPPAAESPVLQEVRGLKRTVETMAAELKTVARAQAQWAAPVGEMVSEDAVRNAMALLYKMEKDGPAKPPVPLTVFRLYCGDGYSAEEVARKCRCAKSTVMSRLRFIEQVTGTPPLEFRAMSGHVQQVDDELRASGAREIYRRGLAQETEDD